jgi:MFS family permease
MWSRQIPHYPDTAARYTYLGIVVLATIVLYYQYYVGGAVAPSILHDYDISFQYYVYILVFGNALGAFASLVAGLADRWGRANLVTYGLLVVGLLTLFGIPNAHSGFSYGVIYALVAIVEGMVLVATPALIRDYSPQVGRATAMGFWTLGPVIGSLLTTEVSSHTLSHYSAWQDQYRIAGIVGLVVGVIAFIGLRELSPQIRDQLMVSLRDRTLIEAKARSIDVEAEVAHPWRSVLRPSVVGGALGISLFLIIYYTAVAFMVIYVTTVFSKSNFSQDDANSMLNWWWGAEVITLIAVGLLSDRLLVRKPFMLLGGVGVLIMQLVLIHQTGVADTSFNTLAAIFTIFGVFISLAYAPWMASFTETVERINPAHTAAGLAVWGWIIRAVVAISFLLVPHVIPSVTPLVDHGTDVKVALQDPKVATAVQYGPAVQDALKDPKVAAAVPIIQAHPAVFAQLAQYPSVNQIPPQVLAQAIQALGGGAQAIQQLSTVGAAASDPVSGPKLLTVINHGPAVQAAVNDPVAGPKLATVSKYGPEVQAAQNNAASEWQHWFWICFAGQAAFLPLILVLSGRWSPIKAKKDEEEYELRVDAEMEALGLAPASA